MALKVGNLVKRGADQNSIRPVSLVANHKPTALASLLAWVESLVGT
jgi:hypothetical protein